MQRFKNIIAALLTPLLYINIAGIAAGAVWIGASGQWQLFWLGIFSLFLSHYVIPVVLIPAGMLSHFMTQHQAAGRQKQERTMFLLSLGYVLLFLSFWCAFIFNYTTTHTETAMLGALWGVCTSMAALLLWASRDRQNFFIMLMVETAQAALLIIAALYVAGFIGTFWSIFAWIFTLLAATAYFQNYIEKKTAAH